MRTLLISGGRVLKPDLTVERADVLADRSTGNVVAVGSDLRSDVEERLDASGGLVIPGMINAHGHLAMTLLRGAADDKPLGDWLEEDVWPIEAELEVEDVRAGAALGALEAIRSGTTGLADMYFEVPETVGVIEESGLRALLGHGIVGVGKSDQEARADFETGLSIAEEYDGAASSRVSTALMPHSLTTVSPDHLDEYVPRAREAGIPIHYHANETTGEVEPILEEHGQRPLEYAAEHDLLGEEDFLAHGVHLDDREIELLAESSASVIHCPASNMKLASGIAPVQELIDAGVTVGLGTDGAASNNDLSVFDELRDAAMVGKLAADDASAVDAATAFGLATTGGADALGFNSGRIEEGANADLAVIDLDSPHLTPAHDLLSHLVYAAGREDVRHTVCDGEVLMRDRAVVTMDETEVRKNAQERAEALFERAGR